MPPKKRDGSLESTIEESPFAITTGQRALSETYDKYEQLEKELEMEEMTEEERKASQLFNDL